ncbi:hypothetical protein [Yinghuangia soli]|uniref:DUF732 domain-containing protein n=1 Tax=Yinghuangia soli TaxID=2908204 RepID=A0AA41Q2E5_9ACTN|nr:hypothetical protein [Yinghuangia soli]MCF2530318.1 hypothetical protein [Yinghuangia soli]
MRTRLAFAALALAAPFAVTGCGDGSESGSDASAGAAPAAASPSATGAGTPASAPATAPADTAASPAAGLTPSRPPLASIPDSPAAIQQAADLAGVPAPSLAAVEAYFADLDAIDPGILGGRRPSRVSLLSNSLTVCKALANQRDPQQLLTMAILSVGTNDDVMLSRDQGVRLVEAIRRNLCAS